MAVRAGMSNPIARLREMGQASTADFTLSGTAYWTDAQLQDILDSFRQDIFAVALEARSTLDTGGTARYYDYYFEPGVWEEGTATFTVAKSTGGTVIPTTYDYSMGHIGFGTVDQAGTAYYLTARRYDVAAAAADVWGKKAAYVSQKYDMNSDGQSLTRSQLKAQYTEMAETFTQRALPMNAHLLRPDL